MTSHLKKTRLHKAILGCTEDLLAAAHITHGTPTKVMLDMFTSCQWERTGDFLEGVLKYF